MMDLNTMSQLSCNYIHLFIFLYICLLFKVRNQFMKFQHQFEKALQTEQCALLSNGFTLSAVI